MRGAAVFRITRHARDLSVSFSGEYSNRVRIAIVRDMQNLQVKSAALGSELLARVNNLRGLSTTSSTKYDELKDWLSAQVEADTAVCYMSDLSKQWVARTGQALMAYPELLILLVYGDSCNVAERLARLHTYVSGLGATLVLVGEESSWSVGVVAGRSGVQLFESLVAAFPGSAVQDVSVPVFVAGPRGSTQEAVGTTVPFLAMDPETQAALVWEHLIGSGAQPLEDAIPQAAKGLRAARLVEFTRLRSDGDLYTAIESAIAYASRRSILFDRPRRGMVRAISPSAIDYSRDDWRDCVLNVMGVGEWLDRDEVVRAAAKYAVDTYGLDIMRLRSGGIVDRGIRSAINGLIRMSLVLRDGPSRLKREAQLGKIAVQDDTTYQLTGDAIGEIPGDEVLETHPEAPTTGIGSTDGLSPDLLRGLLGRIPPESEELLNRLLIEPLQEVEMLTEKVASHLRAFENLFDHREFLDLDGAEHLAIQCNDLLKRWDDLSSDQRRLVQAAALYFVHTDDADDDFGIGGLRTDKAVVAAVVEAVMGPDLN